jgi:hypothetical protein
MLLVALTLLGGCKKKRKGEACGADDCAEGLACVGVERPSGGTRAPGEVGTMGMDAKEDSRGTGAPDTSQPPKLSDQKCEPCGGWEECNSKGWCYCDYDDNKEGCPCGCDRSEQMNDELRRRSDADALAELDESLDTISEREGVGYITEAMVQHRLRLLSLREELAPSLGVREAPARWPLSKLATRLRSSRATLSRYQEGGLRIRALLLIHGETTERVRGRNKRLRASFRLWLGIENLDGEPRTLRPPTLVATPSLPVTRWYLEDGDGTPWGGVLEPHGSESVLVIGYVAAPLKPGAQVDALAHVGPLRVPVSAVAGARWDELVPRSSSE